MPTEKTTTLGLWAALTAFLIWGFLPLYWKQLLPMNALEIICHRMIWSFLTLLPFILMGGKLPYVLSVLKERKTLFCLLLSSLVMAVNWLLFIWAVNAGMVLETSLGYFINPLLNIFLGIVVFKERAGALVWVAIFLAVAGVLFQVLTLGHFPWVALGLGCSFAVYGLIRKLIRVDAIPGLFIETLAGFPFALVYILWLTANGHGVLNWAEPSFILLLIMTGLLTTIPMFLFLFAVMRIHMTTIGILQYIAPSMTFFLGIFYFNEPFSSEKFATFLCIWFALALYTFDMLRRASRLRVDRGKA